MDIERMIAHFQYIEVRYKVFKQIKDLVKCSDRKAMSYLKLLDGLLEHEDIDNQYAVDIVMSAVTGRN